jgi:hypothetical protein
MQVELGFTIPFITIPIKGMNDGDKPLVNVNVGALSAGTILTTAALIFIPKAFSGLEPEISFGKSKFNHYVVILLVSFQPLKMQLGRI